MHPSINFAAIVVILVAMSACVSSDIKGERLQHEAVFDATNFTEINLQFREPNRFLRGQTKVASQSGDGLAVAYPAATAEIFAATVLSHALMGAAIRESHQHAQNESADKVLEGAEQVFDGINAEAASSRLAAALETQMGITAHSITDEKANLPTLMTEPYFALAQEMDHTVLENLVSVSQGGANIYTNRVRLVSRQFDLESPDFQRNEALLADRLLHLYTFTNMIALADAAQTLQGGGESPATWKLSIGDSVSYERATFLGEREDFALLRKLGGNLLLVPREALSR